MLQIGKTNELRIVKHVDFGIYLDGGEEHGEILMPKRYVPDGAAVDNTIEVFIYRDSEDRLIATNETPLAQVDEFRFLTVKSINRFGAFLDWGLPKDLLVPFREQKSKMQEGRSYLVHVYLDQESQRIVASAKLNKFLDNVMPEYEVGEEVNLLVAEQTDLGYKVIIENKHWGMVYKNEVFQPIQPGDSVKGYVKQIRDDDKIDISLQKSGYEQIDAISQGILEKLKESGGYLAVTDKSPADFIYHLFGISKKNYKKAIGFLYRNKLIVLEKEGIRSL
jgi:predicted RNA-binding protein (virulence factor B family)